MLVTKKDVEHVAELARIELSETEKENMIDDLNKVLDYVKKLEELDTENEDIIVNPYYIENKFRSDEIEESMRIDEVMINAPEKLEEYVLVPRIIED